MTDPGLEHVGVAAALGHEFVMAAELDDAPVVDDGDPVGAASSGEPVGDDHGRATFKHDIERALDLSFGVEVEVAGRLVEDQHTRSGNECSCESEKLTFAGGE